MPGPGFFLPVQAGAERQTMLANMAAVSVLNAYLT